MVPKKSVIKTGKPAPKTVAKNTEEKTVTTPEAVWAKIQTAEGWKRSMKRERARAKK